MKNPLLIALFAALLVGALWFGATQQPRTQSATSHVDDAVHPAPARTGERAAREDEERAKLTGSSTSSRKDSLQFVSTSDRPIAGAAVLFFDRDGRIVDERLTESDGFADLRGIRPHSEIKIVKSGYGVTIVEPGQKAIRTWRMTCIDVLAINVPTAIDQEYRLWAGRPSRAAVGTPRHWIPGSVPLENDRAQIAPGPDLCLLGRKRDTGLFVKLTARGVTNTLGTKIVFDLANLRLAKKR